MKLLDEFIIDYLHDERASYAVLISGPWGCGKTYYWKNSLKMLIENKFESIKIIYLSLYGIDTTKEIDRQIFLSYYALNKDDDFKIFGNIGKLILNFTTDKELLKGVDLKSFVNLEKVVLCFDDLERSSIRPDILLGYINKFVEHDGIKTVIISHEDEIRNKDDYWRIKEKTISHTIVYKPDISSIAPSLVASFSSDKKYSAFLSSNIKTINKVFIASESENLRILFHGMKAFRRVFNLITSQPAEDIKSRDELLSSLLRYSLAIIYDLNIRKDSALHVSRTLSEPMMYYSHLYSSGEKSSTHARDFVNRYFNGTYESVSSSINLFNYLQKGFLNESAFLKDISKYSPESKSQDQKDYEAIIGNVWSLSDECFETAWFNVRNIVKKGMISDLHRYLRLFKRSELFIRDGLIKETTMQLVRMFKIGMAKAYKNKLLKYNDDFLSSISSLEHFDSPSAEYFFLKQVAEKINNILKRKFENEKAKEIFNKFSENPKMFFEKIANTSNEGLRLVPIFFYLSPNQFFKQIISINNQCRIDLANALMTRYNYPEIKQFLAKEKGNLQKIRGYIDKKIKRKTRKLSRQSLVLLQKQFDDSISKL